MKVERLSAERAALLIVDIQESFRTAIEGFDAVVARSAILAKAAALLELPIIVTEQYPHGLGATVAELSGALDGALLLEKSSFSAAQAEGFALAGRDQLIVCGIEAHICVAQSVLDLLAADAAVWLAVDAIGSRHELDRTIALQRLADAGATATTVEALCFELLKDARAEHFKSIQALIK